MNTIPQIIVPTQVENRFYLQLEIQGSLVKIKRPQTTSIKSTLKGTRGAITEFTAKSRKRLIEKTARLNLNDAEWLEKPKFVTLTYGQAYPDSETAHNHLRALLERFRRLAPNSSGIWRLEYQKRGAPHFHIIMFNLPFVPKDEIAKMWAEIIGKEYWDLSVKNPRYPMTRIEALMNAKHVMFYVSKYVAKHEKSAAGSGFNVVPYLHAGRFWGVFNAKFLPFAELIFTSISDIEPIDNILWQFRRLAAKIYKRANKAGRYRGCSIFTQNAYQWENIFYWCINEYA